MKIHVKIYDKTKDKEDKEDEETQQQQSLVPNPVTEFTEASLPRYLVEQLQASPNFEKPTPIQS